MEYELKQGRALVLVGPEGCGNSTLAREIASQYGSYAETDVQYLGRPFCLGRVLVDGPKTVIAEGPMGDAVLRVVKGLIASQEVMVELPREEPRNIPTPNFIFCTGDREPLGPLRRDRRFHVVDLPAKPHSGQTGKARRADESPSRALLDEEEDVNQQYTIYRPLLRWTAADCFAMHKKHGIKHNPLYEQGMGRVGCMPCIHASKDELLEIAVRFPEEIERVAAMENHVGRASRRNTSSFFASDKTPGDHVGCADLPMPGIRDVVEWSKTGRGGRQFDWLRMEADGLMCSSLYGLCE